MSSIRIPLTAMLIVIAAVVATAQMGRNAAGFPPASPNFSQFSGTPPHKVPQIAKLVASDGLANDQFGYSIAMAGDTIVVGAPGRGRAWVFVKPPSGWMNMTQTAELFPSDGISNFGYCISIGGDTIVVGAGNSSTAYVYVKPANGWRNTVETAKLTAINSQGIFELSVSEDTVVVSSAFNPGASYVFVKPTGGWVSSSQPDATLAVPFWGSFCQFCVSVSGATIAVGTPGSFGTMGTVYVFVKPAGGWKGTLVPTATLAASDGIFGQQLGISVVVDGPTIVAGANGHDQYRGAVYVFERPLDGQWKDANENALLTYPNSADLGWSVGASGKVVVGGAFLTTVGSNQEQGAVDAFGWNGFFSGAEFFASDGQPNDQLGASVGITRSRFRRRCSIGEGWLQSKPRRGVCVWPVNRVAAFQITEKPSKELIPMKTARRFLCMLALVATSVFAQSNPSPLLYQLSPPSTNPGHSSFTLSVLGTGFVSGATVLWNGQSLPTTLVNGSLVKASVPANRVASVGTASVTVSNQRAVHSNVIYFPVRQPSSRIALKPDLTRIEQGVVTVADFNNDGNADILVDGAYAQGTYYIDNYLGDGQGGFTKIQVGRESAFGAAVEWPNPVADFNRDGKMDVALVTGIEAPVVTQVYLGNGAGKLKGLPLHVDGAGVAADMNGDGALDFVTNAGDGFFEYLDINLYDQGTFHLTTGLMMPAHAADGAPVVGDFNNDGKLDVVMTDKNLVRVFLGNGDGTVQPEVDYFVASAKVSAVADVNGDGKLDIVTNAGCVLLGIGDGTFTNGSCAGVINPYGSLAVADFNGDGKLDIATTNAPSDTFLSILFGNGDGTFQRPTTFDLTKSGVGLANTTFGVADFNNDGKLDFAIGGITSGVVLLQQ